MGQFCPAQAALTTGIGSRSAFASGYGALASTGGAKLGRIVTAAAMKAAIVTAERALIMIVPCGPGLAGRLAEMTPVAPERFMGLKKYNQTKDPISWNRGRLRRSLGRGRRKPCLVLHFTRGRSTL